MITLNIFDILYHVSKSSLRRLLHTVAIKGHQPVRFIVHFVLVAPYEYFKITIKL